MRTFSKSHSLAGLRLGYALGSTDAVAALMTVKDSFNSYPLDRLAQTIGEAAFRDEEYYKEISRKIIKTRERIFTALKNQHWEVLPSSSNFLFARKPGIKGSELYGRLKKAGVLVRHFDLPGIEDFIRITVGTDEQMDRFLETCSRLF